MTHHITFLGDSITFGQYVEPAVRWTSLVTDMLGCGFTCRNEGINGETTRQALERFPKAVQHDPPDILTIQYGLNDCNRWQTDKGVRRVSFAAFRANLAEMIARARTFGVTRIILLTNHPTLRPTEYEESNGLYAGAICLEARKSGVDLCDTYWKFHERGCYRDLLYTDGLHLSPAGHALYAETIWPVIKKCAEELGG